MSSEYALVNGFILTPINYFEIFDSLTDEFWISYNEHLDTTFLNDLTKNVSMLDHMQTKWRTFILARVVGSPYEVENNSKSIEIYFDADVIKSIRIYTNAQELFHKELSMFSFKEYLILSEMARIMGNPFSTLEFNKNHYRKKTYQATKDWNRTSIISDGLIAHTNEDIHVVNDHTAGETLYLSKIEKKNSSPGFNHPHIEQSVVDRIKDSSRLPRGFATNYIYDHFNAQNLPLKSSGTQYTTGAKMWDSLITRALNDKKYVYATSVDGIRQIDSFNKEFLVAATRGVDDHEFENKHLVISHHPIA